MSYIQGQRRVAGVGMALVYLLGIGLIVGSDQLAIFSWMDEYSPSLLPWLLVVEVSILLLPVAYIGGYLLPRRHGKSIQSAGSWFVAWVRGMAIWWVYAAWMAYSVVAIGEWIGNWGAIGWVAIQSLLLIGFQQYLARLIANFDVQPGSNRGRLLFLFRTPDRAFTGGISGIPGQESVIMPQYWYDQFGEKVADLQLARRHGALNTGSHGRGVFLALLINLTLFGLAVWLSGEVPGTRIWLLKTIGWFQVLWLSSLPVIAPMLNRKGIIELDRWIFYKRVDADILRAAIEKTRRFQDEEEWLKHPLPAIITTRPTAAQRLAALQKQENIRGAWHIFPNVVFLSWPGLNLAARILPLNVGRPALWVFLPGE